MLKKLRPKNPIFCHVTNNSLEHRLLELSPQAVVSRGINGKFECGRERVKRTFKACHHPKKLFVLKRQKRDRIPFWKVQFPF